MKFYMEKKNFRILLNGSGGIVINRRIVVKTILKITVIIQRSHLDKRGVGDSVRGTRGKGQGGGKTKKIVVLRNDVCAKCRLEKRVEVARRDTKRR